MKILVKNQLTAVSGGSNFVMTYQFSTEGFSESCQASIVEHINAQINKNPAHEEAFSKVQLVCQPEEINLLGSKLSDFFKNGPTGFQVI